MSTPKRKVLAYDDIVNYIKIKNMDVFLIDVRKPLERIEKGFIPSTINIPLDDLSKALQESSPEDFKRKYNREPPTKSSQLVFSCNSGGRATKAMLAAIDHGYYNSRVYKGGWLDWSSHNKY